MFPSHFLVVLIIVLYLLYLRRVSQNLCFPYFQVMQARFNIMKILMAQMQQLSRSLMAEDRVNSVEIMILHSIYKLLSVLTCFLSFSSQSTLQQSLQKNHFSFKWEKYCRPKIVIFLLELLFLGDKYKCVSLMIHTGNFK